MVETVGFALSVIGGLLILVFLVVIHELGHGIVARRNGVVVEEFGVGFPPLAWGKKIARSILGKNVLYSVNWLPIGGFVKLRGEYDAANKKGDYGAATFWQKTKIILAGVAMNWLFAALLFTILALVGLPRIIDKQFYVPSDAVVQKSPVTIDEVTKGLPASEAGLQKGDVIQHVSLSVVCPASVDAQCDTPSADEIDSIIALTKKYPGGTFNVDYQRGNQQQSAKLKTRTAAAATDGKGYLGVLFSQKSPTTYRSTWSAPLVGVGVTSQLSVEIVKGLGDLLGKVWTGLVGNLTGNRVASQQLATAGDSVAGPVGIVGKILPSAVNAGIVPLMLITAILSVTLAVMNVLPIPALDGGRWYLMSIFKLLRRPLTREIEERINTYGMMFLLGLIAIITVTDVFKFFF